MPNPTTLHLNNVGRRQIVLAATGTLTAARLTGQITQPLEAKPQLEPDLVKQFVSKSHSDLAVVRELGKKEPMLVRAAWDQGAGDWETGLGAASHVGHRDIARYLIDAGARIDAFSVFMLGEMGTAKALLTAFPDLHKTPGPHGIPLVSHAIAGRSRDAFALLVAAGADTNAASWRGATPLMQAVAVEDLEIVKTLLARGADPAVKMATGVSSIDIARRRNNKDLLALLEK